MDFITVNNSLQRFCYKQTGKIFTPIGVNYFPKGTGWAPKIWDRSFLEEYERDFPRIKALGMNTIRVFLSLNTLMPENENSVSETVLGYIKNLLDCAEKNGLRVIFSGPSAWDGVPDWSKALKQSWQLYFTDEEFLKSLEFLWKKIANVCKDHPALFSYDLYNEPSVPWNAPGYDKLWAQYVENILLTETDTEKINALKNAKNTVPEDSFGVNKFVLYEYQMFRNKISYDFCKKCTDAIRSVDVNHMISIGTHQSTVPFDGRAPSRFCGFDPHEIGELLDYISLHFYPYEETIDVCESAENVSKWKNLMHSHINYMDVGKPIMLEEFGMYGGGIAPQFSWRMPFKYMSQEFSAEWVSDAIYRNRSHCSGFLNWGFDDSPDQKDPTRYQGLYDDDGNIKALGKEMPEIVKSTAQYVSDNLAYIKKTPVYINRKDILTNKEYCVEYRNNIAENYNTIDNPYFVFTKK